MHNDIAFRTSHFHCSHSEEVTIKGGIRGVSLPKMDVLSYYIRGSRWGYYCKVAGSVLCFLLISICGKSNAHQIFDVQFKVETSWPRIPILTEAIEFISDISHDDVFPSLQLISDEILKLEQTNQQIHELGEKNTTGEVYWINQQDELRILTQLNSTLFRSPFTGALMTLSVTNRYFSAQVEFLRTFERKLRSMTSSPCTSDTYAVFCVPHDEATYSVEVICDGVQLKNKIINLAKFQGSTGRFASFEGQHSCSVFSFDHFIRPFPFASTHHKAKVSSDALLMPSQDIPHLFIFSSLSTSKSAATLKELLEISTTSPNDFAIVYRPSDSLDCQLTAEPRQPQQVETSTPSLSTTVSSQSADHFYRTEELCRAKPLCCSDSLGGYGAELAVKNPEYKTLDDSETSSTQKESVMKKQSDETLFQQDENYNTDDNEAELFDMNENENNSKEIFNDDPDRVLNEKELEYLGLQAVAEIARHRDLNDSKSSQKQLETWYRLAANFPAEITKLSKSTVPAAISSAVRRLHQKVFERANALTLDGDLIEGGGRTLSLFNILKLVAPQFVAIELLVREEIPLTSAVQLIKPTRDSPETEEAFREDTVKRNRLNFGNLPTRLDWRLDIKDDSDEEADTYEGQQQVPLIPIWNVMNHPSTSRWPSAVDKMSLLMIMGGGPLNVKAPLYHILVIFDPLNRTQLMSALSYLQFKSPMKLYLLPIATQCLKSRKTDVIWDDSRFGPRPSIVGGNASHSQSEDSQCLLRQTLAGVYFDFLLSHDERIDGQIAAIKLLKDIEKNLENQITKGRVTDAVESTIKEMLNRIVSKNGKKQLRTERRINQYYEQLSNYIQHKGLISNVVLFNGRLLELRSLDEILEVPQESYTQKYKLRDVFQLRMAHDQQVLLTGILYDAITLPGDSTAFILSHGSVPSCLLSDELVPNSKSLDEQRMVNNELLPLCEVISWELKHSHSSPSSASSDSPLGLHRWNKLKDALGRFGLQSIRFPFLSPKHFRELRGTKLLSRHNNHCWPINTLLAVSPTVDGLRVLQTLLLHIQNSMDNNATPLQKAFPDYLFCRSLRVVVHPITEPSFSIEFLVSVVQTLLDVSVRSDSLLALEEAIDLSLKVLQAASIVLRSKAPVERLQNVLDELPRQILRHHTAMQSVTNSTVVDLWHYVESSKSSIKLNNSVLYLLNSIRGIADSSSSAAVIGINGQFASISSKISQTSQFQRLLQLLEAAANYEDVEDIVWPSFVKQRWRSKNVNGEKSIENHGDDEKYKLYDTIFDQSNQFTEDSDLLNYAMEIRHRVTNDITVWNLPQKLFKESKSIIKIKLESPNKWVPNPMSIYGIVDPLSSQAQAWIPMFEILNKVLNVEINLIMNPATTLKEYPLARWHRQVIEFPKILSLAPSDSSFFDYGLTATFSGLSTNQVLTTGLHVPDTWLVRAWSTTLDLDNLRPSGSSYRRQLLSATFQLSDIFVEGQVIPATQPVGLEHLSFSSDTIAGLQLSLHSSCYNNGTCSDQKPGQQQQKVTFPSMLNATSLTADKATSDLERDTLVMGNFAYFQLRGNPGLFWIRIDQHTQLQSSRFGITSLGSTTSFTDQSHLQSPSIAVPVVINSLLGSLYQLRIVRIAGNKGLSPAEHTNASPVHRYLFPDWNIWKIVKEVVNRSLKKGVISGISSIKDCTETIHVFSLASGHMYERLLRIMMKSVRQHTKCPLEFWFIDHLLSPKFKQIMPAMAERYQLKYNFVTYKWPSWLRRQTEKQRQIWAYKILFLDVLFPNDVNRIIYIDADQVVRADISQLWNMDLKGAVYGFTPFCDSNRDTEGFRFWKQGYWKNHLQGKPYHISALFVIDLKRFREVGAGDSLRSVYMTLSRDKNSLANLDQDLPNFAQHDIPIYPLPQDWLWCETWCSTEALSTAKTIDLCNNPMTKEPKLSQARRILSEWNIYDEEIRMLEQEILPSSIPVQREVDSNSEVNDSLPPLDDSSSSEMLQPMKDEL